MAMNLMPAKIGCARFEERPKTGGSQTAYPPNTRPAPHTLGRSNTPVRPTTRARTRMTIRHLIKQACQSGWRGATQGHGGWPGRSWRRVHQRTPGTAGTGPPASAPLVTGSEVATTTKTALPWSAW